MKKIFILLILMSSLLMAKDELKDEFGLALGGNTGYGVMYKHHLSKTLIVKTNGGFYVDKDNKAYNLGVSLQHSLRENKILNFYITSGFLITSETISNYNYDYNYEHYEKTTEIDYRYLLGLGITKFSGNFAFSMEFHEIFEQSRNGSRVDFNIYPMVGVTVGILF